MAIKFYSNKTWNRLLSIKESTNHLHTSIDTLLHSEYAKYEYRFSSFFPSPEDLESCEYFRSVLNQQNIQSLVIIGTGGSSLGIQAIYNALRYTLIGEKEIIFWESPHPRELQYIIRQLQNKRTAILWISKSGKTLESILNFSLYRELITTDINNSIIEEFFITSHPKEIQRFSPKPKNIFILPENISGRFSITSIMGALPLYYLENDNTNIKKYLTSIKQTNEQNHISIPFLDNPAKKTAWSYYQLLQRNYNDMVFWIYVKDLQLFGKWLRQLWLESLGKSPLMRTNFQLCYGPEDQHSALQYYLDSSVTSIHNVISCSDYQPYDVYVTDNIHHNLENHNVSTILNIFSKSLALVMDQKMLPVSKHILSDMHLSSLGSLFVFWKYVISYLAFFLDLNPYNQPAIGKIKNIISDFLVTDDPNSESSFREQYDYGWEPQKDI